MIAVVENVVIFTMITTDVLPPAYTRPVSLVWLGVTIALNITLTSTILLILWPARCVAASAMGVLAESAAAYNAVTVAYAVTTATGSRYSTLFLQLFGIATVRTSPSIFVSLTHMTSSSS